MRVELTVTGSGPLWSSAVAGAPQPALEARSRSSSPPSRRRWRGATAPRSIATCSTTSPTSPGWLQPQGACSKGRCHPVAPHLYRRAGARRLSGDQGRRPGVAGADRRARADRARRGRLARVAEAADVHARVRLRRRDVTGRCAPASAAGFQPATADGFAYHPHGVKNGPVGSQPRPRRGADRRPSAAVRDARPAHGGAAPALEHRQAARPVPDRVRLPDVPARHRRRGHADAAGALPPAGRVPDLAQPADQEPHALRVGGRADPLPRRRREGVRRLAVGALLRRRRAQAGGGGLHAPVLDRPAAGRAQRAAVGPGAARAARMTCRCRSAPRALRRVRRRSRGCGPTTSGYWAKIVPLGAKADYRYRYDVGRPGAGTSQVMSAAATPAR